MKKILTWLGAFAIGAIVLAGFAYLGRRASYADQGADLQRAVFLRDSILADHQARSDNECDAWIRSIDINAVKAMSDSVFGMWLAENVWDAPMNPRCRMLIAGLIDGHSAGRNVIHMLDDVWPWTVVVMDAKTKEPVSSVSVWVRPARQIGGNSYVAMANDTGVATFNLTSGLYIANLLHNDHIDTFRVDTTGTDTIWRTHGL